MAAGMDLASAQEPEDRWLSVSEAARRLNVSVDTIRRWTNDGSLPHKRTKANQRRIRLSDLETVLSDASEPAEVEQS